MGAVFECPIPSWMGVVLSSRVHAWLEAIPEETFRGPQGWSNINLETLKRQRYNLEWIPRGIPPRICLRWVGSRLNYYSRILSGPRVRPPHPVGPLYGARLWREPFTCAFSPGPAYPPFQVGRGRRVGTESPLRSHHERPFVVTLLGLFWVGQSNYCW